MTRNKNNQAIWNTRIKKKSSSLFQKIGNSIDIDKRLAFEDILGSKAHVKMLAKMRIITKKTETKILNGLKKIEKELLDGDFSFDNLLEDIHMNIESRLGEIIGADAGRIHTARSRNDQVATDTKIWLREQNKLIDKYLKKLQLSLIEKAEANIFTYMPGFTHLQVAQPITLAHHLLAYVNMFGRDRDNNKSLIERLQDEFDFSDNFENEIDSPPKKNSKTKKRKNKKDNKKSKNYLVCPEKIIKLVFINL